MGKERVRRGRGRKGRKSNVRFFDSQAEGMRNNRIHLTHPSPNAISPSASATDPRPSDPSAAKDPPLRCTASNFSFIDCSRQDEDAKLGEACESENPAPISRGRGASLSAEANPTACAALARPSDGTWSGSGGYREKNCRHLESLSS